MQTDAGIVDENVDPAAEAADLGCEFGRRTGCRQIRGDDVDGQSGVLFQQSGAQRRQLVLASGDEDQIDFALGECDGEILADPAAGSGDQRGLVLEVHGRNRRCTADRCSAEKHQCSSKLDITGDITFQKRHMMRGIRRHHGDFAGPPPLPST